MSAIKVRPRTSHGYHVRHRAGLQPVATRATLPVETVIAPRATVDIDSVRNRVVCADALELARSLPSQSIQTIITSPPYYGLRDYGVEGQIGLEDTPEAYIMRLVELFRELRRALRDDGTLWVNIGDTYGRGERGAFGVETLRGEKVSKAIYPTSPVMPNKQLMMIPSRVALALQFDGWILRNDIIWHKPNPMPESVTDRCTKSHEYVFLLAKSERYYCDMEAIKEPATEPGRRRGDPIGHTQRKLSSRPVDRVAEQVTIRNRRSVWTINTQPFTDAHFAVFPEELIEPMVLAGSKPGDIVYDPFMGSGTTAIVARKHKRDYIGSELNPDYVAMATDRLRMPFEKKQRTIKSAPLEDLPLFATHAAQQAEERTGRG